MTEAYEPTAELVRINPVPSIILDMKTLSIVVVNQATAKLLGYSEEELLGKPLMDLVPAEDHPAVLRATNEPAPEGETQWRCINKRGKTVYVKLKYRETTFRGRPARFVVAIESSAKPFDS